MMKHRAFTLWELLAVVAVLAIGAAILMPPGMFNGLGRDRAVRAACQSNLKQIGLAFMQYARDANDKAPPVANARGGWAQLLVTYTKSEVIFQCPSADGNNLAATGYFYNARLAGAKKKLGSNAKSVSTILSGDGADDADASYHLSQFPDAWRRDESSPARRHLDGANYLFVDGHVKALKPEKITLDKPGANRPTFLVR